MWPSLLRYPLLALLEPPELNEWLASAHEVAVSTGETLFQAGTQGEWAFLVLDGKVRVLRPTEKRGELTLGQFTAGDLFGEYALLPPGRNTATCRAVSSVRLLRLPLAPLRDLLRDKPAVWSNLKNWLRLHMMLSYLRGRSFLGFMSATSALALVDCLVPVTLPAGQALTDLHLRGWFFIESGRVSVEHASGTAVELGPGDCFGERALLGGDGPTARSLAETCCRCLPAEALVRPADRQYEMSIQSLNVPHATGVAEYPWISQQEESDCGVAALAMVAQSMGMPVPLTELRRWVRIGQRGSSLAELQKAARMLRLNSRAIRLAPEGFGQAPLPAVAHLVDGHYVVLYEYGQTGAVVGDPAAGIVTLSVPLFQQLCSGKMLVFNRRQSAE